MADRIQLNPKSNAKLSRRGLIIGGLQTAFIAGLAVRMRKLQVEDASEYRLLADENRINIRLIAPARGEIYDRNGKVIARNEQSFRITIVKEDAGDILEKELRAIEGDPMNGVAPTRNFNNDDERIQAVNEAYETYEMSKDRWIIDYGPLHGEGIWFADEFEGSGVFKDKAHKENMNILFQTLMNNFHSGANQYPKALKGKPTIHLDSKHTMIALTFPPEHLLKTVADKGILQRFLPFIWDVPDDILTAMRKEVIGGFGTRVERRGPPLHLAKGLLEIYKATKAQFEANGKDPFNTITYHPSAKDALDMAHDSILKYIDNLPVSYTHLTLPTKRIV